MRLFVSGIAGFLGSHLAEHYLKDGHEVIGCDSLIGGEVANVPPGAQFHKSDIRDRDAMLRLTEGCEVVFHSAATAYEGLSVFSPHLVSDNILTGSASLFSAAIANKVKRIIFCSSMARYGAGTPPFTEDQEPKPEDPYGIAKYAAELLLKNLADVHGIEYVIAVPHNIIGPRQKYDDPYRNVAAIMINLMLQNRQPIIYGDGNQERCFSYVDDVIFCLKEMVHRDSVVGEVINVGPDEDPVTINELAEVLAELLDFDLKPTYVPSRPQEVKHATCSADKARKMLGYKSSTPLRLALQKTIDYIRERQTRPFEYHLGLEIVNTKTPETWVKQLF
jgi:UDP-glucose 4-epimerase